jgi:DNA replication protein DnaC
VSVHDVIEEAAESVPVCNRCGKPVEVEDYDTLVEPWKRMLDEVLVCDECDDGGERMAKELREMKRGIYASAVADARFPERMRGLRWRDMEREEPEDVVHRDQRTGKETVVATAAEATATRVAAIESAEAWARGEIKGLVLAGRVGVGKSRLAAVAAQGLIYHRVNALPLDSKPIMPIRWVSVPKLIRNSRGDFDSDARRDAQKVIAGGMGLVLDEIDKVKPTEFALDLLFEAIDGRASDGKPLLLTTNMRFPELKDLLGSPIASRIAGYCQGRRIIGEDRREG